MRLTRRQFVGLIASAGFAGCVRTARRGAAAVPHASDTSGRLTFATIGDLHVLDSPSTAIVSHAADMINANRDVQFTIIVGDLATNGQAAELSFARQALRRLAKPWFVYRVTTT